MKTRKAVKKIIMISAILITLFLSAGSAIAFSKIYRQGIITGFRGDSVMVDICGEIYGVDGNELNIKIGNTVVVEFVKDGRKIIDSGIMEVFEE